jgi:hypothetical protein
MERMRLRAERFAVEVTGHRERSRESPMLKPPEPDQERGDYPKLSARRGYRRAGPYGCCDKASPIAGLMLHLRSCYVSKAAILTLPVLLVLVENRSPA